MIDVRKSILDAVEREHLDETASRVDKAITSWHISGFDTCMCGRYLARQGALMDSPYDERTLCVFDVGKMFEKWNLDKLKKTPDLCVTEQVRVENLKWNVSGYVDATVRNMVDDETIVLELKSKQSRAFWHMTKKGAQLGHRIQLWWYLYLLKIPHGQLVYISKDDNAIMTFTVDRDDDELKRRAFCEATILNYCWKNGVYPPPAEKTSWQAKYCGYHSQCTKQTNYISKEILKKIYGKYKITDGPGI